jgi:hypothetical protein
MTKKERKQELKKKGVHAVIALLVFCMFLVVLVIEGYSETHYKRDAVIVGFSENDEIQAEDAHGNYWWFISSDFQEGDEVILTMHTNHTVDNIYDDKVVNAKLKN